MTEKQKAQLTPTAHRLYGELNYLFDFWRKNKPRTFDGSFFVSDAQLRRVLKYSRSSLKRARLLLLEKNMITYSGGGGRGKALVYRLKTRSHTPTAQADNQNYFNQIDPADVKYMYGIKGSKKELLTHYLRHGYPETHIREMINELI